ncbi:MAG: response regulator [Planctomycetes bacterium]|nr:response regulator [Planctomycetota bacterium]
MTHRPLRVLALDDNPADLDLLRIHVAELRVSAVEFTPCSEVADAFAELAKSTYDVLLLDERLGNVSGHEVLCDLRRAGHALPVVLLGACDGEESATSAIRAGAAEYLSKRALSSARLEAAISWALERRPGALPTRANDTRSLCVDLTGAITPTLEAARASLACVLAEKSLSEAQRRELGEARKLCGLALDELERMLDEVRRA